MTIHTWNTHIHISISRLLVTTIATYIFWVNYSHAQGLGAERFECLIEPTMTVMVGAPTQGIIDNVEVKRSQFVTKDQVLATLKSNVEKAAMKHSQVRATMKSEIQAREADLELAQLNLNRIDTLHKKRLVPSQQRDEAYAQLQVAKMAVKQAKDNKRLYWYEFTRNVIDGERFLYLDVLLLELLGNRF